MGTTTLKPAVTRQTQADSYKAALASFLAGERGPALQRAREIGQKAVTDGVTLREMADLHHHAIEELLAVDLSSSEQRARRSAGALFFSESLAAHEKAFRDHHEAALSSRYVNEILEKQAQQIARSLHDDSGQLLVAAHWELAALEREVAPEQRSRLGQVSELLNRVEEELRNLTYELRPTMLDDLGLTAALEFLATTASKRSGIPVKVQSNLAQRLAGTVETALYRIVQEALRNVRKHAQAKQAWIQILAGNGTVHCRIRDDGRGFDVSTVHGAPGCGALGLMGISERLRAIGGTLQIKSARGAGTDLRITLPLEK